MGFRNDILTSKNNDFLILNIEGDSKIVIDHVIRELVSLVLL